LASLYRESYFQAQSVAWSFPEYSPESGSFLELEWMERFPEPKVLESFRASLL
jgi:hypothetical protein